MSFDSVQQIDLDPPQDAEIIQLDGNIYWLRMPLPLALNHINLYLLEEDDGWTLIDTGMDTKVTRELWQQIFDKYLSDQPLKHVISTHMHPDHVGLAGWLCEHWRCPLSMSRGEYFAARAYISTNSLSWQVETFHRRNGMGDDYIEYLQGGTGLSRIMAPVPGAYQRLQEGDVVKIAGDEWKVFTGAGHSVEHVSLYCEARKILLAGDQILPKISPNVGVMSTEPTNSPLQEWYDSLHKMKTLADDTLVLPAHNKPFTGLRARVDELLEHHENQLKVILSECQGWKKPTDFLMPLFGREVSQMELSLAMGECKAHLHMLLDRQWVDMELRDGVEHYKARIEVDAATIPHEQRDSLQV